MSKIKHQAGFTLVEILVASIIFPIITIGLVHFYEAMRQSYSISRELNEMYAVLSACPEIDRALEYDSLTSSANCYPNNVFKVEGGLSGNITYSPTVTVNGTDTLSSSDPLYNVPDSKVVDVKVNFLRNTSAPPLELRMLITRNGIGQL